MRFFHPSVGKLYNVLRRVPPQEISPKVKGILSKISEACSIYSELSARPFRFRVSLHEDDLSFNRAVSMDLLSLTITRSSTLWTATCGSKMPRL